MDTSAYRIWSLDEIAAAEDNLWDSICRYSSRDPFPSERRKLRTLYKAYEAITWGFAPLVYTRQFGSEPTSAHRAMCLTCGHVVATRQPSWMRKHARQHHGVEQPICFSQLRDSGEVRREAATYSTRITVDEAEVVQVDDDGLDGIYILPDGTRIYWTEGDHDSLVVRPTGRRFRVIGINDSMMWDHSDPVVRQATDAERDEWNRNYNERS